MNRRPIVKAQQMQKMKKVEFFRESVYTGKGIEQVRQYWNRHVSDDKDSEHRVKEDIRKI